MFIGTIIVDDETMGIVPRMEEAPTRCRQRISESDEMLAWTIPAATREGTEVSRKSA
jgi:hypothetical protein